MKVLNLKFYEGLAQPVKFLVWWQVLSSISRAHIKLQGKLVKACNPNSGDTETGLSLGLIVLIGEPQASERSQRR